MSWSLNEIEGLARKAARGSGLSWGLAEEAGKATRWLCAAGLPGADALAGLLTRNDGADYATLCPAQATGDHWQATDGPLCPLIAGAVLCDRASLLVDGQAITLTDVSHPMLLIPFVAFAADATGTTLGLSWPGVTISRGPEGTHMLADPAALSIAQVQSVQIAPAPEPSGVRVQRSYRGDIAPEIAKVLQGFAHRTFAPDTEASRLAGAGAGLSDND